MQTKKSAIQPLFGLLCHIVWLFFLQGNFSFQGINWHIDLRCQPSVLIKLSNFLDSHFLNSTDSQTTTQHVGLPLQE